MPRQRHYDSEAVERRAKARYRLVLSLLKAGKTQVEIAERLQVCRQRVSQLVAKAKTLAI